MLKNQIPKDSEYDFYHVFGFWISGLFFFRIIIPTTQINLNRLTVNSRHVLHFSLHKIYFRAPKFYRYDQTVFDEALL